MSKVPLVNVRYNPERFQEVDNLRIACDEVVPAGLHSDQGQLTPGSIEFFASPKSDHDSMSADVFVDIEAYYYDDREDTEYRSIMIKEALKQLFPGVSFAVWAKLVVAGWASDTPDPEFDGSMSMDAAVQRASFLLTEVRTTS